MDVLPRPMSYVHVLALVLAAPVCAQTGTSPPGGQGQEPPGGGSEWPQRFPPNAQQQYQQRLFQQQQQPGIPRSGFPGIEPTMPEFRGFPLYSRDRAGFGGYPGFTPPEKAPRDVTPPTGALRPPGLWPSWLAPTRPDAESAARFDRVILVRNSERVWYRPADETVYVPLPFYDNIRDAEAGAGVQVRTASGALTLLFHDGASLRSTGQITVEMRSLGEAAAELDLPDLHRVWLQVRQRPLRVRLPDTSTLEVSGSEAYLARHGDRVLVRNYGPQPAKVASPLGNVDLQRNQQVVVLMAPVPAERPATALALLGSVRARAEGRTLVLEGGSDGGSVDWLGARVQLGGNQQATIDPLAGTVFPEYRPEGKTASVPPAEAR